MAIGAEEGGEVVACGEGGVVVDAGGLSWGSEALASLLYTGR